MYSKKIGTKKNIDLAPLTTLGIGGKAKYFFTVCDTFGLSRLVKKLKDPFYILGNGSNLLIEEKIINKPIIKLAGEFQTIKKRGKLLEVGSSTLLSFLIEYCIENSLSGLEDLAGIPATIGGMLAVNASSFGASIFDFLEEVEFMDRKGNVYKIKKNEVNCSYRYSSLEETIILKGYFNFLKNKSGIKKNIQNAIKKRYLLQDFSLPSCGSVFKNPKQAPAGKLIEDSGLKGNRKGNMKISKKHANFILNLGRGSYSDSDFLIKIVKDTVFQKTRLVLEEEVKRWH